MMKSIKSLMTLGLILGSISLFSQTATGKLNLSAGVGVVPTFLSDNATVNTPPLSIRLAYQVSPMFQLSGYAGYSSSTTTSPFFISDGIQTLVSNKQTMFGLRGEMRKELNKKIDVYGGALLGYNIKSIREFNMNTNETVTRDPEGPTPFNPNQPKGSMLYAGFVGGTYYFTKGVGLFVEAGYGISLLNTGFTIKL